MAVLRGRTIELVELLRLKRERAPASPSGTGGADEPQTPTSDEPRPDEPDEPLGPVIPSRAKPAPLNKRPSMEAVVKAAQVRQGQGRVYRAKVRATARAKMYRAIGL